MHKLTGKQCKTARGLLKWNIFDLAAQTNGVNPKRIESYERGIVHMMEWETKELLNALRQEGIQFNDEMNVTLEKKSKKKLVDGVEDPRSHTAHEAAKIKQDNAMNAASAETAANPLSKPVEASKTEEKKS